MVSQKAVCLGPVEFFFPCFMFLGRMFWSLTPLYKMLFFSFHMAPGVRFSPNPVDVIIFDFSFTINLV